MATKQRLKLRIDEEDRKLFKQAADEERVTLTQSLVEGGRERAGRLLAGRTRFEIDVDSRQAMMDAMDHPAKSKKDARASDPRGPVARLAVYESDQGLGPGACLLTA